MGLIHKPTYRISCSGWQYRHWRGAFYTRFHFGTERYGGRYEDRQLDGWADLARGTLAARLADGVDVHAYFNNDIGGHAPRDALRLRERLERLSGGTHGLRCRL
jgi:uncharacterized protein YecE (DUF72 family)